MYATWTGSRLPSLSESWNRSDKIFLSRRSNQGNSLSQLFFNSYSFNIRLLINWLLIVEIFHEIIDFPFQAQGALNNCVLGNTTIFAESPAESEVAAILQQLGHGGQQQAGGSGGAGWGLRPTNKAGPPPDTWGGSSSQLWGAPPTSNSLWSNAGIDNSDQQRATPSSLNSYLPGDLLGGESM